MADNSNDRKKTLFISMLVFLLGGGGIFLFFIIQGSNDLTGAKGKGNFTYGEAAREGVTSFFKNIGVISEEEKTLTVAGAIRLEAKEGILDDSKAPAADVSDWMAPAGGKSGQARGNTTVPRMSGGGTSGVGGLGGGGSKSAGGVSRFGEGAESGSTKITGTAGGTGAPAGKGTLGALTKARAALGEGLQSGSAMTAKSSWDRSFGVGGGSAKAGPSMAYAKTGLVNLDKIKKGEVDNLKTTDIKSLKTPEPGAFKEDKDAESKDSVLQKAKQDAAEAAAKAAKEAIAKSMASAATDGLGGTASAAKPATSSGKPSNPDALAIPDDVMQNINKSFCMNNCVSDKGIVSDTKAEVSKSGDGYSITFKGTVTLPDGTTQPNEEVWSMDKGGKLLKQIR